MRSGVEGRATTYNSMIIEITDDITRLSHGFIKLSPVGPSYESEFNDVILLPWPDPHRRIEIQQV